MWNGGVEDLKKDIVYAGEFVLVISPLQSDKELLADSRFIREGERCGLNFPQIILAAARMALA